MRRNSTRSGGSMAVIGLLMLLLGACGQAEDEATPALTPGYEPADCQFRLSGSAAVECGYLVVPEDRTQPDGRMIRLHVAVLRSTGADPKPDPLVYLAGGPGHPALQFLEYMRGSFQEVRRERDVVFLDQRGVGYSEPSLDCPENEEVARETYGAEVGSEEAEGRTIDMLRACRERWVEEGVNLSAYNSAASAADVHELMQALGYERWNLYGVSYGTRLGLTLMRDYPEEIRSAVLDSVVPLEVDMFETFAASAQRALDLVFEQCALDEACQERFPDLEGAFFSLVEKLNQEPMPISLQGVTYQIGGDELVELVHNALYAASGAESLPGAIDEIESGGTDWLEAQLETVLSDSQYLWEAVHVSVWCTEELPFNSASDAAAINAEVHPAILEGLGDNDVLLYASICDVWDVTAAGAVEDEAVVSDIPTLILSGEYDPITPPEFGSAAAEHLENAQTLVVPGRSHAVMFSSPCVQQVVAQFVTAPEEAVDTSCLESPE